jgi:hypothetical protein
VLCAHTPELSASVDEDGLEVGRLASFDGATELRLDILASFRGQQLGEVAAAELRIRVPGGALGRGVHVNEPAIHAVQARRHNEVSTNDRSTPSQGCGIAPTWCTSHSRYVKQTSL